MAFYTDRSGTDSHIHCIGLEKNGTALCGCNGCAHELTTDYVDTIWDLFIEDRIYGSCDCRERLAEHLGIPESADINEFAREQKTRTRIASRRGDD